MTAVYHKIVKLRSKNLQGEIDRLDGYLAKNPGIVDYVVLQLTPAIETMVIMFMDSSNTPGLSHEAGMKDINDTIEKSGIPVIEELQDHKNSPLHKANHLIRISDKDNNELERA